MNRSLAHVQDMVRIHILYFLSHAKLQIPFFGSDEKTPEHLAVFHHGQNSIKTLVGAMFHYGQNSIGTLVGLPEFTYLGAIYSYPAG